MAMQVQREFGAGSVDFSSLQVTDLETCVLLILPPSQSLSLGSP